MADDSDNEIMSDSSVDDVDDDDVEVDSIYESENSSVDSDSDVSDDSPAPRRKRLRTLPPCATASATAAGGQVPSTSAPAPGAPGATASVAGQSSSTTGRDLLVKFTSKTLTGKNGHRWSTKPVARSSSRVPRRNLLPAFNYASPTQRFIDPSPTRCFEEFFTIDILHEILTHTNTHIAIKAQKYKTKKATVDKATLNELSALIGILIFSGVKGDNNVTTKEMFSTKYGPALYRAAMSERRFCFLLRCLRFDDHTTREQRKENDKLAPIRKVWDLFIAQCKSGYTPGADITIDEQLLGFRGRCPFRMYIANKPAKYGIKIIMICDVETKYMLGAIPYLGKHTKPPQGMSLGHFVTLQLVEPYKHTNRNITGDNWFTSMQLVNDLQEYGLTYLGTLRLNKPHTPKVMTDKKVIPKGCTGFLYDRALTMLSYHPDKKKTKFVQLMSTMHDQPVIQANGKPEMVLCYNKTKGAVDVFDQMCARYSCSRKTRRWPLCMFYGMLNAATINTWIIYNRMQKDRGQPEMERRKFMMNLAEDLIFPWAQERMYFQGLQRSTQMTIRDVYNINIPHQRAAQGDNTMKRCVFCPRKKDRKTRQQCVHCQRPVCGEHATPICSDCI